MVNCKLRLLTLHTFPPFKWQFGMTRETSLVTQIKTHAIFLSLRDWALHLYRCCMSVGHLGSIKPHTKRMRARARACLPLFNAHSLNYLKSRGCTPARGQGHYCGEEGLQFLRIAVLISLAWPIHAPAAYRLEIISTGCDMNPIMRCEAGACNYDNLIT